MPSVDRFDMFGFFSSAFPHLPVFITDATFSLKFMYNKRKAMLYHTADFICVAICGQNA